jgi:hypothetical protein
VKGRHRTAEAKVRQPLIEAVKEVGPARANGLKKHSRPGVGRGRKFRATEVAMDPASEIEADVRMERRQACQNFA